MFNSQPTRHTEPAQKQKPGSQKSSRVNHPLQHTAASPCLPSYTQAWGNQPPPWLRLGGAEQPPHEEEHGEPIQKKENKTGLPDTLKAGVENLSGLSMDDVQVHYNSSKPVEVQALAYTKGTEIHVGSGQEQHLAHEAWHVVQQKQGRVKATLQTKGETINDDQELEREADVMGSRARTTQVEKGLFNRPARISDVVQMKPVIQRLVGYEFETGWLVEKGGKALKKKDAIGKNGKEKYDNFKLEADEANNGKSEIEFIVHPPVSENEQGRESLSTTMNQIILLGKKFLDYQNSPSFTLDLVTKEREDAAYTITPHKDGLRANPQVTAGLDLAVIPAYLKAQGKDEEYIADFDEFPKLKGMLVIMRQYLQQGLRDEKLKSPLPYPKILGEPLLARTNFVGLFDLIEKEKRVYYKLNPKQWVRDVMRFAGFDTSRANEDVLSKGFMKGNQDLGEYMDLYAQKINAEEELNSILKGIEKSSKTNSKQYKEVELSLKLDELNTKLINIEKLMQLMVTHANLTVSDWLMGILSGSDKLTTIKDAESMGEFGRRTEEVGEKHVEGGIFEYRGAQKTEIDLRDWPRFALEQFENVYWANRGYHVIPL
jgi:hypothetical protein